MSLKTLAGKMTGTFSKQILSIKTNSPVLLLGVGVVGVTTSVVLACRATLKLNEVLDKGEEDLEKVKAWMAKGAQPSDRVMRFLDAAGVAKRKPRNNPQKAIPRKERGKEGAAAA